MGNNPAPEAKQNPFGADDPLFDSDDDKDNETSSSSDEVVQPPQQPPPEETQPSTPATTTTTNIDARSAATMSASDSISAESTPRKHTNGNDSEDSFATASEGSDDEKASIAKPEDDEDEDVVVKTLPQKTTDDHPVDQEKTFLDPLLSGVGTTQLDDLDELFGDTSSTEDKEKEEDERKKREAAEEEERKKREAEEEQEEKKRETAAAQSGGTADLFGGLLGSLSSPAPKKTAADLFGFDSPSSGDPIFGKGGDSLFGSALSTDMFGTPTKSTTPSTGKYIPS